MFQVILWDIDGTLLNFKMSERYALRKCFSKFHLGDCTDDMIARYSVINTRFWRGLEAGIYTKPQVLQGRFEEFLQFAPSGGRKCVFQRPLCGAERPLVFS